MSDEIENLASKVEKSAAVTLTRDVLMPIFLLIVTALSSWTLLSVTELQRDFSGLSSATTVVLRDAVLPRIDALERDSTKLKDDLINKPRFTKQDWNDRAGELRTDLRREMDRMSKEIERLREIRAKIGEP